MRENQAFSDKNSHIYKHLKSSSACREACTENCFAVLESASNTYKLKIKEALDIMWEGILNLARSNTKTFDLKHVLLAKVHVFEHLYRV